MTTRILDLPEIGGELSFATNADFRGALAFVEGPEISPTPIDITGIAFALQVRSSEDNVIVTINGSTTGASPCLFNGGATGVLKWVFPASGLYHLPAGSYVADLIAEADGARINLCPAPIAVTIRRGVTR